jgi:C4-dicarboxylate transporter, DctQ subunit
MNAARLFLAALGRFERIACVVAFIVMAAALILDVAKREMGFLFSLADALNFAPLRDFAEAIGAGSGVLGAPQIGVIGMIAVAMLGFGVAAQSGAQLRARFLDGIFPRSWWPTVDRIADLITAAMMALLGVLAVLMVQESARMGDVTSVLRWPIWPMQCIIAFAFLSNALRYLLFALFPALRPKEDAAPETPQIEEPIR